MNKNRKALDKVYEAADQSSYTGMMNCLQYVLQDANEAHLGMVVLHLKLAIGELKEYERVSKRPKRA